MSNPPRPPARIEPPKPPPRVISPPSRATPQINPVSQTRFPPPRESQVKSPPTLPPRESVVKSPPLNAPLSRSESSNVLQSAAARAIENSLVLQSPATRSLEAASRENGEKPPLVTRTEVTLPGPQAPTPIPAVQIALSRPVRTAASPRAASKSQPPQGASPAPPVRVRDFSSSAELSRPKPRPDINLSPRQDSDSSWVDTWVTLVGVVDSFELELQYRQQFREKILKFQKLVIEKGFPESQRPDLWELLCGGKAECATNLHHFYEDCVVHLEKTSTKASQDIERDVPRTMQNHPFFQSAQGMACLSHILNVFSFKSPNIGYCQSMNDIAAALVLVYQANERRVFWVLERVINVMLPADYYTSSMIGVRTDCEVFTQLVQQHQSKLFNHCSSVHVDFQIVVMPWFMCVFTKTLPLDSALRVWDFLMLEGSSCFLLRFGLALLQKHDSTLLRLQDTGDIMQYLAKIGGEEHDVTSLIESALALSSSVPDKAIQKMRESQRKVLEKEYLSKVSFSTPTRLISQVVNPVALSGQKALLKPGEEKSSRTLKVVKNPRVALERPTCEKCGEVLKLNEEVCCAICGHKQKGGAKAGVVHAGWLKKKSKQHKHMWQNRYVELWGGWLTYFHSPQDAANNRNPFSVQFTDILAIGIPDQGAGANGGVRFNLTLNRDMGRDTLEFQTATKEQCSEWVALLSAATKHQVLQTEVDCSLLTPEPRLARETVGPSPSGQFNNLSPIRPRQKTEAMTLLWRSMVGVAVAPPSTPSVDQRLKENVGKGYDLVKQIGIPPEERVNVWEIVTSARSQCASNPRAYAQGVEQLGSLENKAISDIRKDVRRTMQNHPFFQAQSGMDALTRVLSVFSVRHPHIGYCQSMNVLAGTLLVIYGLEYEERAYWLLDNLVNNYLPADYYTSTIVGARADCLVLSYLLQEYWPKLAAHLRAHNIDLQMVAMSWFMCLYTDTLDQANALRVWDMLLVSNNSALLVRVALGILAKFENILLTLNQASEFFSLLGRVGQLVGDLMDILDVTEKVVREKRLDERIVKCRAGALATLLAQEAKK